MHKSVRANVNAILKNEKVQTKRICRDDIYSSILSDFNLKIQHLSCFNFNLIPVFNKNFPILIYTYVCMQTKGIISSWELCIKYSIK